MSEEKIFENFLGRVPRRPIFVRSALDIPKRQHEHVLDDLMKQYTHVNLINALARYPTRADWSRRWPDEYLLYGGGVFVTAPNRYFGAREPQLTPEGWGRHEIGETLLREIWDFVEAERPVLWCALLRQRRTFVARFSIEDVMFRHPTLCVAQLVPNPEAEMFRPHVGDKIPPFVDVA